MDSLPDVGVEFTTNITSAKVSDGNYQNKYDEKLERAYNKYKI